MLQWTMEFLNRHKVFFLLLIFLSFWSALLYFVPPDRLVAAMGVETGYLLIILTAFVGVSGFASAPFYAMLVTFAGSGEFNIFLLAMAVAPARAFGDALFFLLGHRGHSTANSPRLRSFSAWLVERPSWSIPFIAYLYTAFTPLPQDLLMVLLGLGKARFKTVIIAVILGNATFVVLVSFAATGLLPLIF